MSITIGIPVHNEEKNIGRLLRRLLKENYSFHLREIIIVASGCTDKSEDIIKNFCKKNTKIKLISEDIRRGKSSAVNIILKGAAGDIIAFVDADNIPRKNSINKLIKSFSDGNVVAASGRPILMRNKNNVIDSNYHLIWKLHHKICKICPKISGELFAIRKDIINEIPFYIINDDGFLTAILRRNAKKVVYVPEAVTYTKEKSSIYYYLRKRRRIARGYAQLRELGLNINIPLNLITRSLLILIKKEPLKIPKMIFAVWLEIIANILASYDTAIGKIPYCWEK